MPALVLPGLVEMETETHLQTNYEIPRIFRPSITRNIADIWVSRRNKRTSDIYLVARTTWGQLFAFHTGEDGFSPKSPTWQLRQNNNAQTPWSTVNPELAKLAYRIFTYPANYVPPERAFSSNNLQHYKKRSKLTTQEIQTGSVSFL